MTMRLQQKFQSAIRTGNYSYATEKSYWSWIRSFLHFHNMKHPNEMDGDHIAAFLSHIVMKKNVSVSTQQQALSALVFLYRHVLNWEDIKNFRLESGQASQKATRSILTHRSGSHTVTP